ncbi:AMP-binding enzyme family protein [Mycobacterium kansasii 732]|uniref:Long-chain-fatty-acid--CoA ligase n=1 Tax=Mycobacterium pseudokansasii TaxID=2341080 RepID=A0A498QX71_9MYCO|nr:class I adenylate-forming enzyme family protein [Mycobacterium pseudokansasii]EUA07552.1 AMP-binding enzyme family protein [Mycobacterium kansasii 732]MBY0389242.1 acyl--CoA ligase [Mycobacterium pseudokansasii]VBA31213.1 Long-chain-fatty-acid--CoA ligase [Mycobacterium pseudokansasii]VBA33168.1 Long-chain-fatty-acid--CoA ligase [Mycobacterium pseudokansasii]VBA54920.1 Long-chain-fatty-acid--CoA ligase [Mycobacterium pseudokansasii]
MTEPAALVIEDRRVSRHALDALSDGLGATLHHRGVIAGERVAVMASNRPEFVAALQAIWRLGAAAVLISPAWKRDEVDHALGLTDPAHAVGDHPVLADLMPMLDLDDPIAPAAPITGSPRPGDDAVLVFSSGTTGLPKAVRHTHASLDAAVRQWRDALRLTERDRIQVATPPSHILGLLNILTALRVGTSVRLHPRFDVDRILRHIENDRITIEMAVAPIAQALASHPRLESYDLSSLRFIMWGATPVTVSIAETVTRRTGVRWVPAYGTTELPVIACNPPEQSRLDSVGRPVAGVDVRIVSLDTGEPVGPGDVGEIQARSASLMAGYLPAAANAEVWRDGWYRTGDVGWLDGNGWLRITDRLKEMIKVRGFQVAPAEVETVLHSHPAVKDCAVFGVPDGVNGEAVVAAVATHAPGNTGVAAELTARVAAQLAPYKRLSRVVFVPEIPRLPSGKVLRRVLKELHGCPSDN